MLGPTKEEEIVIVAFCTVDDNHNGSITIKEIKKFLKGEGYTHKQIKDTMKLIKPYMDNNKLNYDAFTTMFNNVSISPLSSQKLKRNVQKRS